MLLIQITAAQGPAECELAVRLTLQAVLRDARKAALAIDVLESVATPVGFRSVLLHVQGDGAAAWLRGWEGSIQWVFASPLRPGHRRKNWFVAVQRCPVLDGGGTAAELADGAIVFQACRASGKGGQHVNTTDSAVHALHVASGIAVKVMAGRSQHANKRLARAMIAMQLAEQREARNASVRYQRAQLHWSVDRGNPVRVLHARAEQLCGVRR